MMNDVSLHIASDEADVMLTWVPTPPGYDVHPFGLLTARGKDHSLSSGDLRALAEAATRAADAIERETGVSNEATAFPWWCIVDPRQMMKPDVHTVASMVTGPFLSRAEAQSALDGARHRYSDRARVYCASGHRSPSWRALCSGED